MPEIEQADIPESPVRKHVRNPVVYRPVMRLRRMAALDHIRGRAASRAQVLVA